MKLSSGHSYLNNLYEEVIQMKKKKAIAISKKESGHDEYYVLTEKLEEIKWSLEGKCEDIDCDQFIYKDFLKKKYKPVLEHHFSCLPSLKRDKEALIRLLSLQKFKPFRYEACSICKNPVDKLSKQSVIVSFTRPTTPKGCTEWQGVLVHKQCEKKVKEPEGWKKGF